MRLPRPAGWPDLHANLATVARHNAGECYPVGGVADHVDLALRLSLAVSLADLVSLSQFPAPEFDVFGLSDEAMNQDQIVDQPSDGIDRFGGKGSIEIRESEVWLEFSGFLAI